MADSPDEMTSTKTPAKLAEDFQTWWSGVMWCWRPEKRKMPTAAAGAVAVINSRSHIPKLAQNQKGCAPASGGTAPQLRRLTSSAFLQVSTSSIKGGPPLLRAPPYFEVRPSTKGGYGAFALEDIPEHTVIFSEPALLQATDADILDAFKLLLDDEKQRFMHLASFDEIDPNKVIAIFKTNRFRTSQGNCGIFPIASRFNHACYPLCTYYFSDLTQQLVMRTKAAISKGQEITISYGQSSYGLLFNYGFICDCGQCSPPSWLALPVEKWQIPRNRIDTATEHEKWEA